MKTQAELYRSLPQDIDVVWQAMADPRSDHFREGLDMRHYALAEDGKICIGSRIAIMPHAATINKIPWPFRGVVRPVLPVVLEVQGLDPDNYHRLDVIRNPLVQGQIDRTLRAEEQGAGVTVRAEVSALGRAGNLLAYFIDGSAEEALEQHLDMALGSLATIAAELALGNGVRQEN